MPHVFQKQYFWIPVLVCAICFLRMFCRTNSDGNAVSFDTLFDNDHSLSVCHDDSFADAFGKRRMAPSGETVSMVRRKMPWDCRAVLCRFFSVSSPDIRLAPECFAR